MCLSNIIIKKNARKFLFEKNLDAILHLLLTKAVRANINSKFLIQNRFRIN